MCLLRNIEITIEQCLERRYENWCQPRRQFRVRMLKIIAASSLYDSIEGDSNQFA